MLVVLVPINLMLRQRPQDIGCCPTATTAAAARAGRRCREGRVWRSSIRYGAATDWTLTRAMRTARFWWLSLGFFCSLYSWYAVQFTRPSI